MGSNTSLVNIFVIFFAKWNNAYTLKIGQSFTIIFKSDLEFKQFVDNAKDAFLALTGK